MVVRASEPRMRKKDEYNPEEQQLQSDAVGYGAEKGSIQRASMPGPVVHS